MKRNILALSNLANVKGLEKMNMQMEMYMRDSGAEIKFKVKEDFYGIMEMFMKVSLKVIIVMGKVK